MNKDAEKLKTKVQEFLKTLPKEKLDKFEQDAEIINYFVKSEQHLKREPLSDETIAELWGEKHSGKTDMVKNFARAVEKAHGIGVDDE